MMLYGNRKFWPRSLSPYAVTTRPQWVKHKLTHWGRVMHICLSKYTINGSDNGLSPGRRQAINWTNAGILLIGPLGINFSENLVEINTFSFKEKHLKMSSAKWCLFHHGLNELNSWNTHRMITSLYLRVLFYEQRLTKTSIGIMAWISNYIHVKHCNIIINPCHNFKVV